MDADRRQFIMNIMAQEGYISGIYAEAAEGVEAGTELFIAQVEYDLWDED